MWQKTKSGGKAGFDKIWALADKLGSPINRLSNKLGSEAFWPTTLDKECDKAARILRSFCKDGFYEEVSPPSGTGSPQRRSKVLKKIPSEVIRDAKGLAIFTTMRTGFWISGAGGSGVLIARREDGTWSPPSGIMLHTAGLGFLIGVDIYDCVVVINTQKALDAFSKIRCTLGGELSAVAGPVGVGGILDTEVHKRRTPIFTYLKSRGFYAGVQIDGTIIIERSDENERFYGERIAVADILAGKVQHPPEEIRPLLETIKAAQGDKDVDLSLIPSEIPPADYEIEKTEEQDESPGGHVFGVPDVEDPDPFGVLALEKEGFIIREAGSQLRPSSEQFDFRPSPSSPIWNAFSRRSVDLKSLSSKSISRRSSWRTSTYSSVDRSTQTSDMGTQTDFPDSPTTPSPKLSATERMSEIPENRSTDDDTKPEGETAKPAEDASKYLTNEELVDEPDGIDEPSFDGEPEEVAVVEVVRQAAAPQVISRARMITVTKPTPPRIPPRNPIRDRRKPLIINAEPLRVDSEMKDRSAGPSPLTSASSYERPSTSPISRSDSVSSTDPMDAFQSRLSKLQAKHTSVDDEKFEFHSTPSTPDFEKAHPVMMGPVTPQRSPNRPSF